MKKITPLLYNIYGMKGSAYTRLIFASSNILHTHTFWEFAISLKGEYENEINGKRIILKEGNVYLMRPNDVHNSHSFKNGHLHRDVYVSEEKMRQICDVYFPDLYSKLCSSELTVNFYLTKTELDVFERDLDYLGKRQNDKDEKTEALFSAIVSNILGLWVKKAFCTEKMPEIIEQLITKINSGTFMENSVNEIAKTTNYSHGYLCKLFKKCTGVSLNEYVRDFKLDYSLYLLSDKNLSVIEISNLLNYDVPSSFTNAFKKKYGYSPRDARKRGELKSQDIKK